MKIEAFIQKIKEADSITILTGAGISTASGIPDFRGDNGFWKTNKPIYFDEFLSSSAKRNESWKNNIALTEKLKSISFNKGHTLVRKILNMNPNNILITQNIDGLHQQSGVSNDKMIEIHGTALKANCLDVKRYSVLKSFMKLSKKMPRYQIVMLAMGL